MLRSITDLFDESAPDLKARLAAVHALLLALVRGKHVAGRHDGRRDDAERLRLGLRQTDVQAVPQHDIWGAVGARDDDSNAIGFAIIGLFALACAVSIALHKLKRLDDVEVRPAPDLAGRRPDLAESVGGPPFRRRAGPEIRGDRRVDRRDTGELFPPLGVPGTPAVLDNGTRVALSCIPWRPR